MSDNEYSVITSDVIKSFDFFFCLSGGLAHSAIKSLILVQFSILCDKEYSSSGLL